MTSAVFSLMNWICNMNNEYYGPKVRLFIKNPGLDDPGSMNFRNAGSVGLLLEGNDRHIGTVFHVFFEFHHSVDKGEKGMVLAHSDIHAGIVNGSALPEDDVACLCELPAENLDA
jgi:hypothetical protein